MYEEILPSWNETNIIMGPKLNKDQSAVESHRPISLLNVNYKILALFWLRLNYYGKDYTFGSSWGSYARKVINIINVFSIRKIPILVLQVLRKLLIGINAYL